MKETDLKKQKTFRKHTDRNWYDGLWRFQISFNDCGENGILCLHCEINGEVWFLKCLKDVNDLKRVYKALTDEEFE